MRATPREARLIGLLDQIYDAASAPDSWSIVLNNLSRLMETSGAYLFTMHAPDRQVISAALGGDRFDPVCMPLYANYHSSIDPRAVPVGMVSVGGSFNEASLLNGRSLRGTEIFEDFLRKHDVPHIGGVVVARDGVVQTQLSMQGSFSHGPFDGDDLALLRLLAPHFRRAVEMNRLMSTVTAHSQSLVDVLDLLPPAILLGCDRRILRMNKSAENLLARRGSLRSVRNELSINDVDANRQLQRLIGGMTSGMTLVEPNVSNHVAVPSLKGEALTVSVFRLGKLQSAGMIGAPAAIVFVSGTLPAESPDVVVLVQRHYRLSTTEAKIALLLTRGLNVSAVAKSLQITLSTARTHVKRILQKTDSHSQTELVRRLLTGPAGAFVGAPKS